MSSRDVFGQHRRYHCLKQSYELQQIDELTVTPASDGTPSLRSVSVLPLSKALAMKNIDTVVAAALLLTAGTSGIHASSRLRGTEDAICVTTSGSDAEKPHRKSTSSRRLRSSSVFNDAVVSSNVGTTRSDTQVDTIPDQTGEAANNFVTVEYADSSNASAYLESSQQTLPEVSPEEPAMNSVVNATELTPVRTPTDPVTPPVLAKVNSVSSTGIENGASAGSSGIDGESVGGQPIELGEAVSRPKSGVTQGRQAQQLDALLGAMDSRNPAFGLHGQPLQQALHLENHRFFGGMTRRYMAPFQVPRASRRQLQRFAEL